MIDPKELMINNYVSSICHKGLITQVKSLTPTVISLWCNPFANYKPEEIDPIPLTPEILDKCGL